MKQILFIVLLVLCCLAFASPVAAQIPLEVPDIEYPNDLSELQALRRVFVYSTPDPLLRQALLKELSREFGLLDVVERPEDADYFLAFYSAAGQGAESLAATANAGQVTTDGTLIAWRQVKTCDGFRPRVLFMTRKSKTVHNGIVLPLTPLNQGGLIPLNQSGLGSPSLSKKGLKAEIGVRVGLFIIGKLFPHKMSFDQLNNTLAVSFSAESEVQAVREFLRQVKKARKEQTPFYAGPRLTTDGIDPFAAGVASRPMVLPEHPDEPVPCQPESSRRVGANYGDVDLTGSRPGSDALPTPSPAVRPRRIGRMEANAPTP